MDYLAGLMELTAILLLGSKKRSGFVFGLIGNILWIAYVLNANHSYGLLLVTIPAAILNIRGRSKWKAL